MTDRAQNTQVTRQLLEVFQHGRLGAIDELVHPEFINHEAPPGSPQGPEGLQQTISWLRGLWGPMRAEIQNAREAERCQQRAVARGRGGPTVDLALLSRAVCLWQVRYHAPTAAPSRVPVWRARSSREAGNPMGRPGPGANRRIFRRSASSFSASPTANPVGTRKIGSICLACAVGAQSMLLMLPILAAAAAGSKDLGGLADLEGLSAGVVSRRVVSGPRFPGGSST
jgi:hypothetical protein